MRIVISGVSKHYAGSQVSDRCSMGYFFFYLSPNHSVLAHVQSSYPLPVSLQNGIFLPLMMTELLTAQLEKKFPFSSHPYSSLLLSKHRYTADKHACLTLGSIVLRQKVKYHRYVILGNTRRGLSRLVLLRMRVSESHYNFN